jgi:hypothetical protein
MRSILFLLLLVLAFGCRKDTHDLGEDYNKFIGFWIEKDGDASSSYEFMENSKIRFQQGLDRGYSSRIVVFEKFGIEQETGWERYMVQLKSGIQFSLMISSTGDSLWTGGTSVDENSIQQQTKQYYIKD